MMISTYLAFEFLSMGTHQYIRCEMANLCSYGRTHGPGQFSKWLVWNLEEKRNQIVISISSVYLWCKFMFFFTREILKKIQRLSWLCDCLPRNSLGNENQCTYVCTYVVIWIANIVLCWGAEIEERIQSWQNT